MTEGLRQILRLDADGDATGEILRLLREELRQSDPFDPAPVVYIASHERRAREIRRSLQAPIPEGTPERVARSLLKQFAPEIAPLGDVERDFRFFAALREVLASQPNTNRRATRATVDELIEAWRRLASVLPPEERTPERLTPRLASLGKRGELLASALRRYVEALPPAVDPDETLWLAARTIDRTVWQPKLVVIDELDRIPPARLALLRALAGRSRRLVVVLRGGADDFPFLAPAQEALQGLVLESASGQAVASPGESLPRAGLVSAWRSGETTEKPPDVNLHAAADRISEVRAAAREIKRAALAGASLDGLCVAVSRASVYAPLIEEVFSAAGIPFDAPFEEPLSRVPSVAALLGLVRTAMGGLERLALLDALASPLLPFRKRGDGDNLRRFEEATREAGIVGGRDIEKSWLDPLDKLAAPKKLPVAARRWGESVLHALAPLTRPAASPREWFGAIEALLAASEMERVLYERGSESVAQRGFLAAGLHAFRKLLRSLLAGFGEAADARLSRGDLWRVLIEQARTRTVRPPERRGSRVAVLGFRELRGVRFERVFLLGLTDEDLPLAERDSMFFPLARREQLSGVFGEDQAALLASPVDVAAQADYLFASALHAGAQGLTLFFPRKEGEKPLVPAGPFSRLLETLRIDALDKLPAPPGDEPVSPHELASALGRMLDRDPGAMPKQLALKDLADSLHAGLRGRRMELERSDMAAPPGVFDGAVGAIEGLARFGPRAANHGQHLFSPSQIDAYVQCPMQFWGRYALGLKRPEDPTLEPPPSLIGTFVHAVLERFVHLLRTELGVTDAAVRAADLAPGDRAAASRAGLSLMARACGEVVAEFSLPGPFWRGTLDQVTAGLPGYPSEAEFGQGVLASWLELELDRNAEGAGILFAELTFGKKGAESQPPDLRPDPVEIDVPGGEILFQGSVDRVDETPEGLDVIDYKTGKAKSTLEIRDGKAFQLPMYLAAVSQLEGRPPAGLFYYLVPTGKKVRLSDASKSGNRKTPLYDVGELVKEKLPERLGRILAAMESGVFVHLPPGSSGDPCKYCDLAQACYVRPEVVGERAIRARQGKGIPNAYEPDGVRPEGDRP